MDRVILVVVAEAANLLHRQETKMMMTRVSRNGEVIMLGVQEGTGVLIKGFAEPVEIGRTTICGFVAVVARVSHGRK
jgi:hypothetical protein